MTDEEKQTMSDLARIIGGASYLQGVAGGIQEAARTLRDRAGDAYRDDQDERAEICRELARELEQTASLKDDRWRQVGGELERMERARAEIDARVVCG